MVAPSIPIPRTEKTKPEQSLNYPGSEYYIFRVIIIFLYLEP